MRQRFDQPSRMELLMSGSSAKLLHIPYKGASLHLPFTARQNREPLFERLAQHFRQHPTPYWIEPLERADIICAPVQDYAHAMTLAGEIDPSLIEDDTHPIAGTIKTLAYSGFAGISGGKLSVTPTLERIEPESIRPENGDNAANPNSSLES